MAQHSYPHQPSPSSSHQSVHVPQHKHTYTHTAWQPDSQLVSNSAELERNGKAACKRPPIFRNENDRITGRNFVNYLPTTDGLDCARAFAEKRLMQLPVLAESCFSLGAQPTTRTVSRTRIGLEDSPNVNMSELNFGWNMSFQHARKFAVNPAKCRTIVVACSAFVPYMSRSGEEGLYLVEWNTIIPCCIYVHEQDDWEIELPFVFGIWLEKCVNGYYRYGLWLLLVFLLQLWQNNSMQKRLISNEKLWFKIRTIEV